MARNKQATGQWTFSTIQDANIYGVRAALVDMENLHIPYEAAVLDIEKSYADSHSTLPQGQWAARYLLSHWTGYTKIMVKDVLKLLTGNSMKTAAWMFLKDEQYGPYAVPAHSPLSPWAQFQKLAADHPALGVSLALYMLFLGLAYVCTLTGLWTAWHEKGWTETLTLFSSIFYFAVVLLGVDAQGRYRLPIMPALFLFAGGGFHTLYTIIESRGRL